MPPLPISHSTRKRPAMIWGVSILVTLSFGKEGRCGGALVLVLCGAAEKERRIRTGLSETLLRLSLVSGRLFLIPALRRGRAAESLALLRRGARVFAPTSARRGREPRARPRGAGGEETEQLQRRARRAEAPEQAGREAARVVAVAVRQPVVEHVEREQEREQEAGGERRAS